MEVDYVKKQTELEEAIVWTIAFFDLFSYPLTVFEIWKYLDVNAELSEILEVLDGMTEKSPLPSLLRGQKIPPTPFAERGQEIFPVSFAERGQIEEKNGFYFLAGRGEIIKERMARYNYTDKKFRRAVWVAKIFKFVPWIKMIAIGNIIGAHNLKKESDIDFFIITEANRIWLTRFFCVSITKILGLRPKPEKTQNKICLSFFASEEEMNLERLMLYSEASQDSIASLQNDRVERDIYFIYWLAGLAPIYDRDNIFSEFINKNDWLKNYLPNWKFSGISCCHDAGRGFSWFYRDVVDMFLSGLEKKVEEIQLEIMPEQIKDIMNMDSRVVVSDKIIKLHLNDRREEYREKFKMQNLKCKMTN